MQCFVQVSGLLKTVDSLSHMLMLSLEVGVGACNLESSLFLMLSEAFLKRKGNTGIQIFDGVAANACLCPGVIRAMNQKSCSSVQGVTSMFNYFC